MAYYSDAELTTLSPGGAVLPASTTATWDSATSSSVITTSTASLVFYIKATLPGSTTSQSKKVVVMVCEERTIASASYFETVGTALWHYEKGDTATISNFDTKVKSMFTISPVDSNTPECNEVSWSLWSDAAATTAYTGTSVLPGITASTFDPTQPLSVVTTISKSV